MKPKQWVEYDGPDVHFRSHFISTGDSDLIKDFESVMVYSTVIWWLVWLFTMNETAYLLLVLMGSGVVFLMGYCRGLDTLPIEIKVVEND